jgi:hypothetical protein
MKLHVRLQHLLAGLLMGASFLAVAQVEDTDAARLAARFVHLAGNGENAMALVLALRTGSTVQLAASDPAARELPEMVALEIPTAAMSWNDVRITLLNVQDQLIAAGIVKPTIEQLQAALVGGEVISHAGSPRVLRGVLQLRAEGLSWLDIARASDALPAARRVSGTR